MERANSPIDNYEIPGLLPRVAGATLDLAIFIFVTLVLFSIGGFIASKEGQPYTQAVVLVNDQIHYAQIAKIDDTNQYVAFNNDDLLTIEGDNSLIINHLFYFYCAYLTGENVSTDLAPSLHYQELITVNGVQYAKKDYYTVNFFNTEILHIGEENSFFVNQETGGIADVTKVGVVNSTYLETVDSDNGPVLRIKNEHNILTFLAEIYQEAISLFYSQSSIVEANNYIAQTNGLLMLVAGVPSFMIFYLLIPLLSVNGRTIGKHLFKLTVVDNAGYRAQKWRVALRGFPIFGTIIYISIINSLYYQMLLPLLLLMISAGILIFNTKRKALHDWMAGTIVINAKANIVVFENAEKYESALAAIKERSQNNHEQ